MAVTDPQPLALPSGAGGAPFDPLGALSRPTNPKARWRRWLFTVDHKKIGIMYGTAALIFFMIGGSEALLIRSQLWSPRGTLLSAETYNQVFTMHGTTMVFLVVMPIGAAFANYLMPLQIGARDVAFPRINAFSFWCFLAGGLFLNSSWLFGGGADGGWFNYAPNSGVVFSPGHGIDYWNLGLIITGVASLTGAVNLIVTVLNMRCPGMDMFKMPIFTWMTLVTQFLLLFAIPVLTCAQFLLMFDRLFGANFFNVQSGGNPLLWENLFWVFGHPEVYLMILPAFGLVSEILPVFARKPIFGYNFIVFSGIAIGFMGWGVWAHHMFVSGIGPISVTTFSLTTMFIAVPTGVKILNWTATLWGGKLQFTTPMLYAIGLICMFTIGGLSGVTDSVAPADTQQHDTYYIVAHFHYVLFGGAFLGFMGGFYFYWPKVFGYLLNERLGKTNFWIMLLGFNLTFGPMHMLGLQGMSRRIYTYDAGYGFELWNKRRHHRCVHAGHQRAHLHLQHLLQPGQGQDAATGRSRSMGCAHHRVDDPVAGARVELRPGPDRHPHRRVLVPQVRRDRGPPPRAHPQHRRGGPAQRRQGRAPAVAVVLADHRRLLAADHRLRPDLHAVAVPGRRAGPGRRRLRLGPRTARRARRRPR